MQKTGPAARRLTANGAKSGLISLEIAHKGKPGDKECCKRPSVTAQFPLALGEALACALCLHPTAHSCTPAGEQIKAGKGRYEPLTSDQSSAGEQHISLLQGFFPSPTLLS